MWDARARLCSGFFPEYYPRCAEWGNLRVTSDRNHSYVFFFSSRRRHTRLQGDWSSDVCSSDLIAAAGILLGHGHAPRAVIAMPVSIAPIALKLDILGVLRLSFLPILLTLFVKIGRASCRERV